MWIFPAEQALLFGFDPPDQIKGEEGETLSAGDGGGLVEVNARELAKQCLTLIGEELGFA